MGFLLVEIGIERGDYFVRESFVEGSMAIMLTNFDHLLFANGCLSKYVI